MKRARRMGLHPRHDLSNPTRRCGGNDQARLIDRSATPMWRQRSGNDQARLIDRSASVGSRASGLTRPLAEAIRVFGLGFVVDPACPFRRRSR